jgi:uncharacterized protein Yka (UPF0111/DUF47 family)
MALCHDGFMPLLDGARQWHYASTKGVSGMATDGSAKRDHDKFIVRLPDGMRERIAHEAKVNGRSMNAEIVERLERTLESDDVVSQLWEKVETLEEYVSDIDERLGIKRYKSKPMSYERLESLIGQIAGTANQIRNSGDPAKLRALIERGKAKLAEAESMTKDLEADSDPARKG